jgi:hypothetical protein
VGLTSSTYVAMRDILTVMPHDVGRLCARPYDGTAIVAMIAFPVLKLQHPTFSHLTTLLSTDLKSMLYLQLCNMLW